MQVRGTFPELYAGMKSRSAKSAKAAGGNTGKTGFSSKTRPRAVGKSPSSLEGRRNLSHARAKSQVVRNGK